MAKWLKTNGESIEIFPSNRKSFKLQELQLLVGGYIEVIDTHVSKDTYLVINEEGKLQNLRNNAIATLLSGIVGDVIVGDAVLCSKEEIGYE